MRKLVTAIGAIMLIISLLIVISILLGVAFPPGYLSANALWLFVAGIVLILWSATSKQGK
jgi:hypothetical protein